MKKKIEGLEDLAMLEKSEKMDYENILKEISLLNTLNNKIKNALCELLQNIKDLAGLRKEKQSLLNSLTLKEQRYHSLVRSQNQLGAYQREISLLKNGIDRERQELNAFEQRVHEH